MDNNPSVNSGQAGSGRGNNFFSGFLLGALVGAAVVFLFATKKGKKILKAISEKGGNNLSNILEKAERAVNSDGIHEEDELSSEFTSRDAPKEKTIVEKPKVRRFFRGIPRHLN